jgi:hypothetical protein
MRHIGGVIGLAIVLGTGGFASAAGANIDPDPASPLLGELLAREAASRDAAAKPEPEARRGVRTAPQVPRGATTVIVPGGRLR